MDVSSSWLCVFILGSTFSLKIAGSFPHYSICLQKALRHKLSECNTQHRKTCFCLGLWSGQTSDTQSLLAFCARFRICFDCLDRSLLKSEMLFYCNLTSSPSGYSMGGWGQVDIIDYTTDFFGWHFSICRPWMCLLWNQNRIVEQTFLHFVFRSRGYWMKWIEFWRLSNSSSGETISQLNVKEAISNLFDNILTVYDISKQKWQTFIARSFKKCQYFLFSVSNVNIFGVWTVDQTKLEGVTLSSGKWWTFFFHSQKE